MLHAKAAHSVGMGRLYIRYIKVRPECAVCGEILSHIRADDFPPYLTIVIIGQIVVPFLLLSE